MAHSEEHTDGLSGLEKTSMSMYAKFDILMVVGLALMWVLSMSMVRTLDHVYFNLSNLHMALMMVSAMGVVMVVGMWSMLKNTKANIALLAGFAALFVLAFSLGRTETFVGNESFLKSMIPHRPRAILMCQESTITDAEIEQLCGEIVETQREKITRMEQILGED